VVVNLSEPTSSFHGSSHPQRNKLLTFYTRIINMVYIVGGRYRPKTFTAIEADGAGLSIIFQPKKEIHDVATYGCLQQQVYTVLYSNINNFLP